MRKRLASGQIVYDPRGAVTPEPTDLAVRFSRLEGIRLGILDNSKWNGSKLLRAISALLKEQQGIDTVTFYKKESFSRIATEELIGQIASQNDAVITAIGD